MYAKTKIHKQTPKVAARAKKRSVAQARLRVSEHKHTGRRLPWHHTSYALLFFILILTGLLLLFARQQVAKAGPPQIQNGNVQLGGVVPGPPPITAATIDSPPQGSRFSQSIIGVTGTCTAGLVVEIYRNNSGAGSVICANDNTYTLSITLVPGENNLKARISDALNQYGPDSSVTVVYYDVPITLQNAGLSSLNTPSTQGNNLSADGRPLLLPLLVSTRSVQAGILPREQLLIEYQLIGGRAPFAVSISWGDGTNNTLISVDTNGIFKIDHQYKRAGQYKVTVTATDHAKQQAIFYSIVVVSGPANYANSGYLLCSAAETSPNCSLQNQLQQYIDALWPIVALAVVMTISFWLGEKVMLRRLHHGSRHSLAKR